MPLFRRSQPPVVQAPQPLPEPPAAATAVPEGDLPCAREACDSTTAVPCRYTDRRGHRCDIALCREHRHDAGSRPLCPRHAAILAAIRAGSLLASPLPDVGNRAPSVLAAAASKLDSEFSALLTHNSGGGQLIRNPGRLTFTSDRHRTWTQRWSVASHRGPEFTLQLAVSEAAPHELVVNLDGRPVTSIPAVWQRRGDEPLVKSVRERVALAFEEQTIASHASTNE